MKEEKEITLRKIARLAKVSTKTVSRVVNAEEGVGIETRERIQELIKAFNYYPHAGARSMRRKSRDSLGVIQAAPRVASPLAKNFIVWLFDELQMKFASKGDIICLDLNPLAKNNVSDYARGLWEQRFYGCILLGPLRNGDRTFQRIHDSGRPYMYMGRFDTNSEYSTVTVDNEEGAYLGTKHLISLGHTRIGMVKAFDGYYPGLERERGYLRALEEAGITPDVSLVRNVSFNKEKVSEAIHEILIQRGVTAILESSGTEDPISIRKSATKTERIIGKDFDIVAWSYSKNSVVIQEACAHIFLPIRDAVNDGIGLLDKWFHGERDGPFQVLHKPMLQKELTSAEEGVPKPLFNPS